MIHGVIILDTPDLLHCAYSECSDLVDPFLLKKLPFHDKLKGLQCKASQVLGLRQSILNQVLYFGGKKRCQKMRAHWKEEYYFE